ncbi:Uma2 family endonuclease [Larkinella rosea]|uniref:Uma2 family endonuclease n=1 Tax=Larkinella rosea TaxID=2025312 RepID=A0A3P1BPB1_9BACT|nr:Uma2 family endonuclease [Larkinella rosea]RRB02901.1 Uma2 family endonuclease [Larkinella rosea]
MDIVTDFSQLDPTHQYSYADYLTWEFGEWVELIGGYCTAFNGLGKSPLHQSTVSRLGMQVHQQLASQKANYDIWTLPLALILGYEKAEQSFNLVMPDIYVIQKAEPNYTTDWAWHGVPEWIVEVTDSRTLPVDQGAKYDLYQYFGVKDYWVVLPEEKRIVANVLNERSQFQKAAELSGSGQLSVHSLPDISIDWSDVFEP